MRSLAAAAEQRQRLRVETRFAKKHDWIALEHVAPYAPSYNPIERFWKWLNAQVYEARVFGAIAEGIGRVRQIAWHDHEG